jgi:xanthine/CO dehydrogenase XdhC/CoxF family maturation factor
MQTSARKNRVGLETRRKGTHAPIDLTINAKNPDKTALRSAAEIGKRMREADHAVKTSQVGDERS